MLQGAADGAEDTLAGRELTQTPKHSASLWTTYGIDRWTFGYGATYQGAFYPNNNSEAWCTARPTRTGSIARWSATRSATASACSSTCNNLFDEEYYTSIRNNLTVVDGVATSGNGWAIPGDRRSAVLTATFKF